MDAFIDADDIAQLKDICYRYQAFEFQSKHQFDTFYDKLHVFMVYVALKYSVSLQELTGVAIVTGQIFTYERAKLPNNIYALY